MLSTGSRAKTREEQFSGQEKDPDTCRSFSRLLCHLRTVAKDPEVFSLQKYIVYLWACSPHFTYFGPRLFSGVFLISLSQHIKPFFPLF